MKFTKKWKNFWQLQKHTTGGFTLVELIVVIAILAILAGIGVPAYSGYVTKANKQADMTLVSEVARALQLHYYSDPTNAASGYVVLSTTGADADDAGVGTAAMQKVFGDSWQTSAVLKYDGWSDDGILAAAAGQSNIAAVGASSYIKNNDATSLLGTVQELNNSAVSLLNKKSNESVCRNMSNYLGDGFVAFCEGLGIHKVNSAVDGGYVFAVDANSTKYDFEVDGKYYSYPSDAQMSNLMTLYVSDSVGNTADDTDTEINYSELFFTAFENGEAINADGTVDGDKFNTCGLTMTEYLAVTYAMYSTVAENDTTGKLAANLDAVDASLSSASSMGDVLSAMNKFWANPEVLNNCVEYLESGFTTDMDAVVATLGAAGEVSKNYYEDISDLNDKAFLSSDAINGALDSFFDIANVLGDMNQFERDALIAAAADGKIVVVVGETGTVAVTPVAVYPVK